MCSRIQAIVSSRPWSRVYRGFQPQSDWARAVPASRRSTSLAAGRTRSVSVSTSIGRPSSRPIRSTSSPIEMSSPRPMLTARPSAGVAAGDRDEARDRVLDVGQVAAGVEPAELHHGPRQGLADDRRDDRAGRLPGAERVERPEDRHRQAERAVIALAQGIGGDLGRRVGRLARGAGASRRSARTARCRRPRTSRSGPPARARREPGRRRARGPCPDTFVCTTSCGF